MSSGEEMTKQEQPEERCVICEQGHDIPHRCSDPSNPNATTPQEQPEEDILTAKEFREMTMGCFYQDELRAHDSAMRAYTKRLTTQLEAARREERERILSLIPPKKLRPFNDVVRGFDRAIDEVRKVLTNHNP